jgi:hypothetical protein
MRQGTRIPRGDGPSLPVVPGAVARWATKVTAMATRLGPHCARAESRQRALADVQGLLGPIARQTGWSWPSRRASASLIPSHTGSTGVLGARTLCGMICDGTCGRPWGLHRPSGSWTPPVS